MTSKRKEASTKLPDLLNELHACDEAKLWAENKPLSEKTWNKCNRPDWLLWLADTLLIDDKKTALATADCIKVYSPKSDKEMLKAAIFIKKWIKKPKDTNIGIAKNIADSINSRDTDETWQECLVVGAMDLIYYNDLYHSGDSSFRMQFSECWEVVSDMPNTIQKIGSDIVRKHITWKDILKGIKNYLADKAETTRCQ